MLDCYPSRQLPVELIFLVLDCLDVTQLVRASHICRSWRAVARKHPTFWRNIRLASSSTSALDFFQARLDETTSKGIYIDVQLKDCVLHGRVRSVVLPAVARNLARALQLGLDLHHGVSERVFDTLSRPAPILEGLGIGFSNYPDDEQIPTLPLGLLAKEAPRLRTIAIKGVLVPALPITVFSGVETIIYTAVRPVLFPASIFEHCPALRALTFFCRSCLGIDWGSKSTPELSAPRLEKLEVHHTFQTYHFVFDALPNLSSLPTIVCRQVDPARTHALFGHLAGPLEMDLLVADAVFARVGYFAPSSGRSRQFVHYREHILEDWPRDVIFDPRYTQRVQTLYVSTQMEWLVRHCEPLSACHTLHLLVDEPAPDAPPDDDHRALLDDFLPALKTVVVGTLSRQSISATRLQGIVARIAGARSSRLVLRVVDGVQLTGDDSILEHDFERTCT